MLYAVIVACAQARNGIWKSENSRQKGHAQKRKSVKKRYSNNNNHNYNDNWHWHWHWRQLHTGSTTQGAPNRHQPTDRDSNNQRIFRALWPLKFHSAISSLRDAVCSHCGMRASTQWNMEERKLAAHAQKRKSVKQRCNNNNNNNNHNYNDNWHWHWHWHQLPTGCMRQGAPHRYQPTDRD